jgi:hypothetical protein
MKRLAFAALMTIVICVVMMLSIGIDLGCITPSHAASGVHGYAHVNCSATHRFLC